MTLILLATLLLVLLFFLVWTARGNRKATMVVVVFMFVFVPAVAYGSYLLGLHSANQCFTTLIQRLENIARDESDARVIQDRLDSLNLNEYEYACWEAYETLKDEQ